MANRFHPSLPVLLMHISAVVVHGQVQHDLIDIKESIVGTGTNYYDLYTDNAGNSYAVGLINGTVVFGPDTLIYSGDNNRRLFVVKHDADLELIWYRTIGPVTIFSGDGYYDFARHEENDEVFVSLQINNDNLVMSGSDIADTTVTMATNAKVLRFGNDGTLLHVYPMVASAKVDVRGEHLYTMDGNTNQVIRRIRLDDGTQDWQTTLGSSFKEHIRVAASGEYLYAIANPNGNTNIISCQGQVAGPLPNGMGVVKLDTAGVCQWVNIYGPFNLGSAGTFDCASVSMADDRLFVLARNPNTITFGPDVLQGGGNAQGHLVAIGNDGSALWGRSVNATTTGGYMLKPYDAGSFLLSIHINSAQVTIADTTITIPLAQSANAGVARFGINGQRLFADCSFRALDPAACCRMPNGRYLIAGRKTNTTTFGNSCTTWTGLPNGPTLVKATEVSALEDPPPVITQNGADLVAETFGDGPYTYVWRRNGVVVAGATEAVFTPTQNGGYTVTVTNPWGCSAQSGIFDLLNVGTMELDHEHTLSLFPVPTTGILFFATPMRAGLVATVLDGHGRVVMRPSVHAGSIDISPLADGLYFVGATIDGRTYIQRVMFQR
ncbi:MAG: T9SS type A sorting domain-containing protein [Flavobacteriales bacterium]|nr:T9SS type A sorting domain-containing protein [Flavobacteriales bacterium]